MNRSANAFAMLADRIESGDLSARGELRRKLEPEMVQIVRRVVRHGAGASSMDRRILAEAQRLGLNAEVAASPYGETLLQTLAHTVSSLCVERLRSNSPERQCMEDTVRD